MYARKQIQQLLGGVRDSFIGSLLLVVLIGSLHTVVTTATDINEADFSAAVSPGDHFICDYPMVPGNCGREGVATDGHPFGSASTHWILPLIVKTDNSGRRYVPDNPARLNHRVEVAYNRDREPLCTSTFLICPALGRQFTLVGAKPSGTS